MSAAPVAAHGQLILELGSERIQPGGLIEIRGDFGVGEVLEVALISKADGSRRLIATISAVEDGPFQSYVTLPADVPVGDYLLEVAVDLSVVRAPLTVAGSPEVDGLVQPLGSGAAGGGAGAGGLGTRSSDTALPGRPQPTSTRTGRAPVDGLLIIVVATAIAIGALIAIRLVARGRVRALWRRLSRGMPTTSRLVRGRSDYRD
jgi:hypothetical protein